VKPRPVLSTTAFLTALVLAGTAGTAAAATTTTAALGTASSALNLLNVQAGGHNLGVGTIAMTSSTLTGSAVATIDITPAVVDGVAYGAQHITPASGATDVASQTTPSALSSIVSLASPAFTATATKAPSTKVGSTTLGSLNLLGMAVPLNGTLDLGSAVNATTGALANKTVSITNLSLPSIADLLAALGLNLNALPVGSLSDLVDQLDLVNSTIDTAQTALASAAADVDAKTAALASSNATLTTATTALNALLAQVNTSTFPTAGTITGYLGLSDPTGVNASVAGLAAAATTYNAAKAAVDAANALLNTAQALVTSTTATLLTAIDAVLDGTPLVSLGGLTVTTKAAVASAKAGGQTAQIVGGEVTGLKVLGTDVLKTALGTTTVDALDVVGSASATVSAAISTVTGTLSSVLSNVPGFPALSIPAPQVSLLTKTTSTSIASGFGKALASVTGLKITLPAVTIPSALALPSAANLPALTGVTQVAGALTSAPVQLDLVTLSEQSAFRPSVTTVSTPQTPGDLPRTGLPVGVAIMALLALVGAVVLRRRSAAE
jgi:hypothetical protein